MLPGVADESYDALVANGVLTHVERPSVALANWIRVVRPGGTIGITLPVASTGCPPSQRWGFAVQDPSAGERQMNLLELLQVVCHLVEIEGIIQNSAAAARHVTGPLCGIEVRLRKRHHAQTPVQSNRSSQVEALTKMTRTAIAVRSQVRPMAEFDSILASGVLESTVVDLSRLYLLYQWLLSTIRLPGHCIEIGVFRGGTAKLISEVLLRRQVAAYLHLFDTFAGLPDRFAADEVGMKGTFADTTVRQVRRLLANNPRVRTHRGVFPDSIPSYLNRRRFRFAHIDVDIERSVRDCLSFVYPRLVPGGVMIVDDYGHPECPGATRAVEAFFADKLETVVQMPLLSSAVILKATGD